ncbi:Zinc finger CCCH domain-containing protein 16 [Bienertia sinuspersici]
MIVVDPSCCKVQSRSLDFHYSQLSQFIFQKERVACYIGFTSLPFPALEFGKATRLPSCRFGDRCKFLHSNQQQPKPNAFGFGSQTASPFQQQKPNPFGFGVQNNGATSGAPNFGGPGQKPFENKWVRPEQPTNQSQAATHKCTDPDSCKRQIAEDFQNERPLWKLTCYGHYKYLSCDITGDVSYEELRAVAYDDAKRGTNLQAIVERERGLVKSKEIEFENLRQNPYAKHTLPAQSNQSSFPAVGASFPSLTPQNSGPSPFPTSSQQSPSPNLSFGVRPSTPSTSGFGQFQGPGPFGSKSVPSGSFSTQAPAQTGGNLFPTNLTGFGSSGTSSQGTQFPAQGGGNTFTPGTLGFGNIGASSQGPQVPTQTGPFTSNTGGFGNSGGMSSQGPQVPVQNSPFISNVGGFGNSGSTSAQGNQSPSTTLSLQSQSSAGNNSSMLSNGPGDAKEGQQLTDNNTQGGLATDASIWLKKEWKCGEIPEQPPPAEYCR